MQGELGGDAGVRMSLDELRGFVGATLRHVGLGAAHVPVVTETMVAGERDGCTAHGVYRLLVATHTIRTGKVKVDAAPVVTEPAAALVRVDGDGGFAQLAFERGRPLLVEKARKYGIAALAVNRCVHFAALWPEVEAIASEGLVTLALTANHAWVAPAGGTRPLFGTNPIAFGWPREGQEPFVFDFATSAISRGDLELHRRAGKMLPAGCGIDAEGRPTIDPAAVQTGAMLPFGGHKGSALALMVELMAGPLIGDLSSAESLRLDDGAGASPYGGELILAIDPSKFGAVGSSGSERAEAIFAEILGQGARLPSQRRYAARRKSAVEGVVIPRALYEELAALSA
ncbi:MAG TPA: Ldh family oxidoreductase [Acidobacteriaceae bacterium]|nr:Ldh family oxidoreductase [Acidobacteriaceae bacterium]